MHSHTHERAGLNTQRLLKSEAKQMVYSPRVKEKNPCGQGTERGRSYGRAGTPYAQQSPVTGESSWSGEQHLCALGYLRVTEMRKRRNGFSSGFSARVDKYAHCLPVPGLCICKWGEGGLCSILYPKRSSRALLSGVSPLKCLGSWGL